LNIILDDHPLLEKQNSVAVLNGSDQGTTQQLW
jgi:hypothetical protein